MKQVFRTDMKDVVFELEDKEVVDMPDLNNEIEGAKSDVEKELEEKK